VDKLVKRTVKTVIEEPYQYGITFIPEQYIFIHWAKWFHVVEIRRGQYMIFRISLYCDPGNEAVLRDTPAHCVNCDPSEIEYPGAENDDKS